jgi:hypothetical protein
MKDKVVGRVPLLLERELAAAAVEDSRVALKLRKKDGLHDFLHVDHVIAATGFRVDLSRLNLLSPALRRDIAEYRRAPILTRYFESSVPGLYFIGPAAAASFGPMMRFTFGARYTARRLTRALAKSKRASEKGFVCSRRAFGHSRLMPKVLVAAALVWPNAVRLCRALRDAGFEVGAIAVPQHPVHHSKAPNRTFDYRPKAPLKSLRGAIANQTPDIIIPCDDRILGHLCALRAVGDDDTSTLIETSLGRGGASGVIAKRGTLAEIRQLPKVDVPRTDCVASVPDLQNWVRKFGLPAVLKLDGSWGGRDIVVVRRESEIRRLFWEMRLRQSGLRGVKCYVTKRDVEALRRPRSAISVQSFVAGRPANVLVACWRGKVLAQIAVEAVEFASPFGMATVVRVVDGDAMVAAARSICSHYMLSGLHGFDFIIEEGTGAVKLIEINPRATQVGHLNLGPGRDLAAALFEALSGRLAARRPPIPSGDISLFPGEWRRDSQSSYLTSTFHDVPHDDVDLALYYGFDLSGISGHSTPAAL